MVLVGERLRREGTPGIRWSYFYLDIVRGSLHTRGFLANGVKGTSESELATVQRNEVDEPLKWTRAVTYSLEVISTSQ
jgi:hypothetical protein